MTYFAGDVRLSLRFWNKVRVEQEGCWIWTASTDRGGYGTVRHSGKIRKAHRVAFEVLAGAIADGLDLDHLCRTRACVNPAHLEPVTRQVNVLRGVAPAARNAKVGECLRGHDYDETNTYVYVRKDGRVGRYCRACRAERGRSHRLGVAT